MSLPDPAGLLKDIALGIQDFGERYWMYIAAGLVIAAGYVVFRMVKG